VPLASGDSGRRDVATTPGRAEYQVTLETSRTNEEWTSATRTRTDWWFRSQAPRAGAPATLPMLEADYRLGQVRAAATGKAKLMLRLVFRDQHGATVRVKTPTIRMSLDGGATWARVTPMRLSAHSIRAWLPVGRARTVSLSLDAAAAGGRQQLRQTVIDAMRLR
jgi:hypothetical protein